MKAARRLRGGRRLLSLSEQEQNALRGRLDKCKHLRNSTVDQIVDHLLTEYPVYRRKKLRPFTRLVQETLDSPPFRRSTAQPTDADEELGQSNSIRKRKRRSRNDDGEEKLQRLELSHSLRRRNGGRRNDSGSSSSSPSSSDNDDDENDGTVSMAEEAEPEFDLMKSMLRESYRESQTRSKLKEKNLELELPARQETVELMNGNDRPETETKALSPKKKANQDGPRFKDFGGLKKVIDELTMEVLVPLYHPQILHKLRVKPMSGILLSGPPGCGKTRLAHAIANEAGVPFYQISATEIVSGVSGASEEKLRDLFSKARRTAPSIVFIDEIDAIASKRENLQQDMGRRIVTQLMTCMDESHNSSTTISSDDFRSGYVLVIGATNRPDSLDRALRRPGRFDREINVGVPDENSRVEILSVLEQSLGLEGAFDLVKIARSTAGFVGADLVSLANRAGNLAMKRSMAKRIEIMSSMDEGHECKEDWLRRPLTPEETDKLAITMADFEEAVHLVQPSSKREGFSVIPNVKWEDVGGLDILRQEFKHHIVERIKDPEIYEEYGLNQDTGFLLYGPPGCGKTLIAKAVANEAGANFIHIKGPELLNKYVGDSEQNVRNLFSNARTCSPCILFFDEVDALTTKRGSSGETGVAERLLNQLLIELDGADERHNVFVIGATNRPDVMDRAVLRPGRFGKLIYVAPPTKDERGGILRALARKKPIDASVDLSDIGQRKACENFSGADLAALMNEAAMAALKEYLASTKKTSSDASPTPRTIRETHFEQALAKITPSITYKQMQYYQKFAESLNGPKFI